MTESKTPGVNESGTYVYKSTLGAEIIELPKFGGSRGEVESVQMQHFGMHVTKKIEAAFGHVKGLPYKDVSGADPCKALAHYAGAGKGAGVLDEATSSKMSQLSRAMAESSDPQRFYRDSVRTFLLELAVEGR